MMNPIAINAIRVQRHVQPMWARVLCAAPKAIVNSDSGPLSD